MPEKAISTADLPLPEKAKKTCGTTIWMDYQTLKDLNLIAAYERMKRGPLMLMIIMEKIRTYQRNPMFKRFLLQLRQADEDKKRRGREDE